MYTSEGNELVILETTLPEEVLSRLLPELLAETGTKQVRYEIPGGMILLPERLEGVGFCVLGYAAQKPAPAAPRREGRVVRV